MTSYWRHHMNNNVLWALNKIQYYYFNSLKGARRYQWVCPFGEGTHQKMAEYGENAISPPNQTIQSECFLMSVFMFTSFNHVVQGHSRSTWYKISDWIEERSGKPRGYKHEESVSPRIQCFVQYSYIFRHVCCSKMECI